MQWISKVVVPTRLIRKPEFHRGKSHLLLLLRSSETSSREFSWELFWEFSIGFSRCLWVSQQVSGVVYKSRSFWIFI